MRYRASNGILTAELSEAEAREHYEQAAYVRGEFGGTFVTCPVGEFGHLLTVAATRYTPIWDEDERDDASPPWPAETAEATEPGE